MKPTPEERATQWAEDWLRVELPEDEAPVSATPLRDVFIASVAAAIRTSEIEALEWAYRNHVVSCLVQDCFYRASAATPTGVCEEAKRLRAEIERRSNETAQNKQV